MLQRRLYRAKIVQVELNYSIKREQSK